MSQVGRISGPLLNANLERQGIGLSFKNVSSDDPILFIDSANQKLSVNYNGTPLADLYVPSQISLGSKLIAGSSATFGNFTISSESIAISSGDINLNAGNTIRMTGFGTRDSANNKVIVARDNNIGTVNNNNIVLQRTFSITDSSDPYVAEMQDGLLKTASGITSHARYAFWNTTLPSGFKRGDLNVDGTVNIDDVMALLSVVNGSNTSGDTYDRAVTALNEGFTTEFFANTTVDGNVTATGNITADGNITLGSGGEDNVSIGADINNNLLPDVTDTYDLGSAGFMYKDGHAVSLTTDALVTSQSIQLNSTIAQSVFANNGPPILYADKMIVNESGKVRTFATQPSNATEYQAEFDAEVDINVSNFLTTHNSSLWIMGDMAVSTSYYAFTVYRFSGWSAGDNKCYVFNRSNDQLVYTFDDSTTAPPGADDWGGSIAMNDSYIAIGNYSGSGSGGYVDVYDLTTGALAYELPNPTSGSNYFGASMCMTPDGASTAYLGVGAHYSDIGANNRGAAYVYRLSDGQRYDFLSPTIQSSSDHFGVGIDMNKTQVAIAAPTTSQEVYIYELSSMNTSPSTQTPSVTIPKYESGGSGSQANRWGGDYALGEGSATARFSNGVCLTDSYIIISSASYRGSGSQGIKSGKVYQFDLSGNYIRSFLTPSNAYASGYESYAGRDRFGASIDATDSKIVIGATSFGQGGSLQTIETPTDKFEQDSATGTFYVYDASTGDLLSRSPAAWYQSGLQTYAGTGTSSTRISAYAFTENFGARVRIDGNHIFAMSEAGRTNQSTKPQGYMTFYDTSPPGNTIQNIGLDVGNTFYVAQHNGNDTNSGTTPYGPFKTIKRALDAADASTAGPVTIRVFAGGYEEVTPLVVPSNVTITGEDMRNTTVRPESAYQSNDVFHLTGETTVQNLTVKDFYYDSSGDTGYAFRFAPSSTITTRSPYIQNITVITQGTSTSASDPRGFASGDAGKGALVDGASVLNTSEEASMLFHSVTFITPGVDALTCTNGVRVEWLNCFTYFANRGLYCKNGSTGHLSSDGSTTKYGAELRSIASANVYGNFGIVGDGADVLIYAINHNLAYIGVGKFVDNDPSRAIQANEVVETNSAKVYFTSQDHSGNFRVGDAFHVDLEDGTTSLNLSSAEFSSLNSLILTTGGNATEIYPDRIELGDFRLKGQKLETVNLDLNLNSYSNMNMIKFLDNVNMQQNFVLDQGITIGGGFAYIGEQIGNTLVLGANIGSDLDPSVGGTHDLGTSSLRWKEGYFDQANVGDINLVDTKISTVVSNANLELVANGTGKVIIPSNTLEVKDLSTPPTGTMTFNNFSTQGITTTGDITVNQDFTFNDLNTTTMSINGPVSFATMTFEMNNIRTTDSNADLELRASGTGNILFQNNTNFNKDATVNGTLTIGASNFTRVTADFSTGDIQIYDNVIETSNSNSNLELRPYTGKSVIAQKLKIDGTNIGNAPLYPTENITLTGTHLNASSANKSIRIPLGTTAERGTATAGQFRYNTTDNIFEAYSTGWEGFNGLYSDSRATKLLVHPTSDQIDITVSGASAGTIDATKFSHNGLQTDGETLVNGNTITTVVSNSDLELRPNGNGNIFAGTVMKFEDNKFINTTSDGNIAFASTGEGYAQFGGTTGIVIPVGTTAQRPENLGNPSTAGQLRYNTTLSRMEVYTGSVWENSAGFIETVPLNDAQDINFEQSLIFG